MSAPPELKPCPLCGATVACVISNKDIDYDLSNEMFAACCNATNKGCGTHTGWQETIAEATDAWNTRAESAELTRLRAELAEAMNLLSRAADALEMSYDAQEWPANGESSQEKVAAEIRATLDRKGEKE